MNRAMTRILPGYPVSCSCSSMVCAAVHQGNVHSPTPPLLFSGVTLCLPGQSYCRRASVRSGRGDFDGDSRSWAPKVGNRTEQLVDIVDDAGRAHRTFLVICLRSSTFFVSRSACTRSVCIDGARFAHLWTMPAFPYGRRLFY